MPLHRLLPRSAAATLLLLLTVSCSFFDGEPSRRHWTAYGHFLREARYEVHGTLLAGTGVDSNKIWIESADRRARPVYLPVQPALLGIDPKKIYHIEVLDSRWDNPDFHEFSKEELARVGDGPTTIYDASVCTVHHRRMIRVDANQPDTERSPDEVYLRAAKKFPNDGLQLYTDCGALPKMVWACPECARLSKEWALRHHPSWLISPPEKRPSIPFI